MASGSTASPQGQLSNGIAIEYKAYVRKFFEQGGGTLFIMATCYYETAGFTISLQQIQPGHLNLVETPPTGIHTDMVSYYVADWTSNVNADNIPGHVTITDAHGAHRVAVKAWS
jgi:hypothetical protein